MTTERKSIATPRKGSASGSWRKRDGQAGDAIEVNVKAGSYSGAGKPLVVTVTKTASSPGNRSLMIRRIKQGLDYSVISKLEKELNASLKEVGTILSISPSTMSRRKREGHLNPEESDRVVRLARLKDAAVELMDGNEGAAIQWLRSPLAILEGETPLEHAVTELGARDVEDLIVRLQHGVFS